MADPTSQVQAAGQGAGSADAIGAVAGAVTALAELAKTALVPGILSVQSVLGRLASALPAYRNPFATPGEDPRIKQNNTLILVLVAVVALLILAVVLRKKPQ